MNSRKPITPRVITSFLLSIIGNQSTPVCGQASAKCMHEAFNEMLVKEIVEGFSSISDSQWDDTKCNCLPLCTSITYDAEISQANFNAENLFIYSRKEQEFLRENPDVQFARLLIFFKEAQFNTLKRSELYGPTDFLANCGGLLGLFMGVSLLSFVELVYFCSVRLCCNLRLRQEDEKNRLREMNQLPGITGKKSIETDLNILKMAQLFVAFLHDQSSNVCLDQHTKMSMENLINSTDLPTDLKILLVDYVKRYKMPEELETNQVIIEKIKPEEMLLRKSK